jgi:sec-independent protein translocase protein TatA/sec-independent protein translocase protein TatB
MFGMGMPEILLILAIALIVIGPQKLPELAKSLGRALNEFKRATNELKDTMDLDGDLKDVKQSFNEIQSDLKKKPIEMIAGKTSESKPKTAETDSAEAATVDAPAADTAEDDDGPATDIPAELMMDEPEADDRTETTVPPTSEEPARTDNSAPSTPDTETDSENNR